MHYFILNTHDDCFPRKTHFAVRILCLQVDGLQHKLTHHFYDKVRICCNRSVYVFGG